jgi:hypothetical protein
MLLEFKEDALNGHYCWSSFSKDRKSVNSTNLDQLRPGFGKLTKGDVLALAGRPAAKTLWPSTLIDFKDRCGKNTEVWGWYAEERFEVNGTNPKTQALYISFDGDGQVSGVKTAEMDSLKRIGF